MIQNLKRGETTDFQGRDNYGLHYTVRPSRTGKMYRKMRTNEHYDDETGSFLC